VPASLRPFRPGRANRDLGDPHASAAWDLTAVSEFLARWDPRQLSDEVLNLGEFWQRPDRLVALARCSSRATARLKGRNRGLVATILISVFPLSSGQRRGVDTLLSSEHP
jgi:hypothetical protein